MSCVCGSRRIMAVSGKVSDMCNVHYLSADHDGYVPADLGIGSGDYLEFDVCMDCHRMINHPTLSDKEIVDILEEA